MAALPPSADSTAVLLKWTGVDTTSGVDHFELQSRKKILGIWGPWQDLQTDIDPSLSQLWQVLDLGGEYSFRMRAADQRGNVESYPSEAEATTSLPSSLCQPADSWESDNTLRSATVITSTLMTIQSHSFSSPGSNCLNDEDWLEIPVTAGNRLEVTAQPQAPSAAANLQLYRIEGLQQVLLAERTAGSFGKVGVLVYDISQDGKVYLRLRHIDGRVAGAGVKYEVRVVQGKPVFLPALVR
jgi:hypothetical protein